MVIASWQNFFEKWKVLSQVISTYKWQFNHDGQVLFLDFRTFLSVWPNPLPTALPFFWHTNSCTPFSDHTSNDACNLSFTSSWIKFLFQQATQEQKYY